MKDKWMKFFTQLTGPPEINPDKALTNEQDLIMEAYISDKMNDFETAHIIRAYDLIRDYSTYNHAKICDRLLTKLYFNITSDVETMDHPDLLVDFCKAYKEKHFFYYFYKDKVSMYSQATNLYFGNSKFTPRATTLEHKVLADYLSTMFVKILPLVYDYFDDLPLNKQTVILSAYSKMDMLEEDLCKSFLNKISEEYLTENNRVEALRFHDFFQNCDEDITLEFVNVIDNCLHQFPTLKNKVNLEKVIPEILKDYLKYIDRAQLIITGPDTTEHMNFKLKGLLYNDFLRYHFNSEIIAMLSSQLSLMQEAVIKAKPSSLILCLKYIDPKQCDSKAYLNLLRDVTEMAVREFEAIYPDIFVKNYTLHLVGFKTYQEKAYVTDRLIEIKDNILNLMEMHHNDSLTNQLDPIYEGENIYQTITNEPLFDAYMQMIMLIYSTQEINGKKF